MEVFVVFRGSYEDRYADSVHATLASAQSGHEHPEDWREVTDGLWTCEHHTVHHRAKLPAVVHLETRKVEVDGEGMATLPDGRKVPAQGYQYVSVPVMPDGTDWVGLQRDWVEDCDAGIQSFTVRE